MTEQQYTCEEMKVEECWEEEEWKKEDREEAPVQIKKELDLLEQDLQEQDLQEEDPLQEITQVLEARSTMLCIKCHQGQSLFIKFYFLCDVSGIEIRIQYIRIRIHHFQNGSILNPDFQAQSAASCF
jgi:hypothetical protein